MISAALIVKNEEFYIERCLNSIREFDEVIIVDTGSTDRTKEKCKMFTDKIFDFEWNDNFADARNFAKSKAKGEYIFSIDADEILLTPIEKIKKQIDGKYTYSVDMINGKNKHKLVRLFKNCEEVFWVGAVHEVLNIPAEEHLDIEVQYDYSPAHQNDPDRTIRILTKELEKKPNLIREKYYLAREYWYLKDYKTAIEWFEKYLKCAVWLTEIADANLYLARCYWNLNRGDIARIHCLNAIGINPDFKEALLFMGEMSFEVNKSIWHRYAKSAKNRGVLFIR